MCVCVCVRVYIHIPQPSFHSNQTDYRKQGLPGPIGKFCHTCHNVTSNGDMSASLNTINHSLHAFAKLWHSSFRVCIQFPAVWHQPLLRLAIVFVVY